MLNSQILVLTKHEGQTLLINENGKVNVANELNDRYFSIMLAL